MFADRLDDRIEQGLCHLGITFTENMLRDLRYYAAELERWNRRMNLVGLKDVDSIITDLIYDAFFLYQYVKESRGLVDIGSGAGILAIPLKIVVPDMRVFAVDKSLRKIQFQSHIKRILQLKDFTPIHSRVEEIDALGTECLVAKAFGAVDAILEKGGRHLRDGGRAYLLKGRSEVAPEVQGFALECSVPYRLPVSEKHYRLLVYRKEKSVS